MKWVRENKLIVLLAAIKFFLPFILVNSVWELQRDEYLYYQQGQHLALGYMECPPLIGLLAYISSLAGGSAFFIRLWPCLFGAATLIITAEIAKELGGKLFARFIAALGILLSAYLRTYFLFQPNFLDIFFWTLSIYFLLRYINTQQNKYLIFVSIAFALGWWSKYSILFFIAAILLSILFTKHRNLFTKKYFYAALVIGVILIIPNLLWQYFHKFPLVHHMDELRETQLKYINKADFIKNQLLMLFPVLFVWMAGLIWLLFNNRYRFIAYVYFGVIILLMLGSGKSYYALGAYPMLLAAGGVCLEKISIRRTWLRYAVLILILAASLPFVQILLPMQSPEAMALFNKKYKLEKIGILKWEDQKNHPLQQDFADMLGWKELTEKTEKFYHSLSNQDQQNCMILCGNYGEAGALNYYAEDKIFKQKVISLNGSFLLWLPPEVNLHHLILVSEEVPDTSEKIFNHFKKRIIADSISNPLSRQFGNKIIFFQNADSVAVGLARDKMNERKQQFMR